jgi:hypothetical protein
MATSNGFLMGSSTINTINANVALNNQPHTGFKFNGNCLLDSICIRNYVMTNANIISASASKMPVDWTPDVIFLANMDNTVDGSNVFGLVDVVESYSLYRQGIDEDVSYPVIENLELDITSWIDYKCEGNQQYTYLLFANTATQLSNPIVTDSLLTTAYGYFLISSDADIADTNVNSEVTTFKFDLNVTSDKSTINNSAVLLQNFTQFDSIVTLNRNFRSGDFSSLLIPFYNNDYDFDGKMRWAEYLTSLQDLIMTNSYKYLKTKNGGIMKVMTTNTSSDALDFQYNESASAGTNQLCTVTVYWNEIGTVENTVINTSIST